MLEDTTDETEHQPIKDRHREGETALGYYFLKLTTFQGLFYKSAPMSRRKYLSMNWIFCASSKDFWSASALSLP